MATLQNGSFAQMFAPPSADTRNHPIARAALRLRFAPSPAGTGDGGSNALPIKSDCSAAAGRQSALPCELGHYRHSE
jgi:hypothetical protein